MVSSYSFQQFKEELLLLQSRIPDLELHTEVLSQNPFLLKEYETWASFTREFDEASEKVKEEISLQFDIVFDTTNSLPGLYFRAFKQGVEVKQIEEVLKIHKVRIDFKPHPVRKFNPQCFYLHECEIKEIIGSMENKLEGWFSTVFSEVFGVYITN